jgi:hypothetical protein
MRNADGNAVNCEHVQSALAQSRGLMPAELAHVESCDVCMEAWLTQALDAKPEVQIPADFAARVVANLPEKRAAVRVRQNYERHWGLLTAILLVAAGLIAAAVADPTGLTTRIGVIFMLLVVSEIAGITLWLATDLPSSQTASRGRSR